MAGENEDVVVGRWKDGRLGAVQGHHARIAIMALAGGARGRDVSGCCIPRPWRGHRLSSVGGGDCRGKFFTTRAKPPVPPYTNEETLEIFAFLDAAQKAKEQHGRPGAASIRRATPTARAIIGSIRVCSPRRQIACQCSDAPRCPARRRTIVSRSEGSTRRVASGSSGWRRKRPPGPMPRRFRPPPAFPAAPSTRRSPVPAPKAMRMPILARAARAPHHERHHAIQTEARQQRSENIRGAASKARPASAPSAARD